MILDTSFLIDVLRGEDAAALQKSLELDKKFEKKAITSISVIELWRGALLSNQPVVEKEKIHELINSLPLLAFGLEAAKKTAEIESQLKTDGSMIDLEDIMIAGLAMARNEKILTRDSKHFSSVKGIEIETY